MNLNNSDFDDVLEPGIFARFDVKASVAFSGTPGNFRAHLRLETPDGVKPAMLQPLIEALMTIYAQNAEDGFEAALDRLMQGAMIKKKVTKKPG